MSARMRLGFVLPQVGPMAGPDALVTVARRAETLGFDSLWVTERLLYPLAPRAPYPPSPDGTLPTAYKTVLDPVATLAFVAAHTTRVRLGTSVLDIPYYNPVLLARQLTTLDVVSDGRLDVGLGLGWSPDEFEATGATMRHRGERADEFIELLKTIWTSDPVEHHGKYFQVARSVIGPKPVQKPHPPLYLAAYSGGAMRRAARHADGWNPAGIPLAPMARMLGEIRALAREAERAFVALIVRANCHVTEDPGDADRKMFSGNIEQITEDAKAVEAIGAREVFFDVQYSPHVSTTADILALMEKLAANIPRPV